MWCIKKYKEGRDQGYKVYVYMQLLLFVKYPGVQMPIKHPTSGGQAREQAAVQWTFHLVRSIFLYHNSKEST